MLKSCKYLGRLKQVSQLCSSKAVSSSVLWPRLLHSARILENGVSLESIRELRKRTGAPIGEVKKALLKEDGDLEAAIDNLRKLGASLAAKKAHRDASEGLVRISMSPDSTKAAIVELNSETDFVARTSEFQHVLGVLTDSALGSHVPSDSFGLTSISTEALLSTDAAKDIISNAVSSLGENIVLKRVSCLSVKKGNGSIFGYVHGAVSEGNGRIGALVAVEGLGLKEVGPRLAMHVAAAAPSYLSIESIPPEESERERTVIVEAIAADHKPVAKPKLASIVHNITKGRMKKWHSSVVLEEQEMLVEAPTFSGKPRSVAQHLASESNGARILAIVRFSVGEK